MQLIYTREASACCCNQSIVSSNSYINTLAFVYYRISRQEILSANSVASEAICQLSLTSFVINSIIAMYRLTPVMKQLLPGIDTIAANLRPKVTRTSLLEKSMLVK